MLESMRRHYITQRGYTPTTYLGCPVGQGAALLIKEKPHAFLFNGTQTCFSFATYPLTSAHSHLELAANLTALVTPEPLGHNLTTASVFAAAINESGTFYYLFAQVKLVQANRLGIVQLESRGSAHHIIPGHPIERGILTSLNAPKLRKKPLFIWTGTPLRAL